MTLKLMMRTTKAMWLWLMGLFKANTFTFKHSNSAFYGFILYACVQRVYVHAFSKVRAANIYP